MKLPQNRESSSPASTPNQGADCSAVIRARYEADVGGVNRYKHFFQPLASSPHRNSCTPSDHCTSSTTTRSSFLHPAMRVGGAESIDKKLHQQTSPRSRSSKLIGRHNLRKEPNAHNAVVKERSVSRANSSSSNEIAHSQANVELPSIASFANSGDARNQAKDARTTMIRNANANSGSNNNANIPILETWRIRRVRRHAPHPHTQGGVAPVFNRSCSPNPPSVLPSISPQISSLANALEGSLAASSPSPPSPKMLRGQQIELAKRRFIPPPPTTFSTTATSKGVGVFSTSPVVRRSKKVISGEVSKIHEQQSADEADEDDRGGGKFRFPKIALRPTGFDLVNERKANKVAHESVDVVANDSNSERKKLPHSTAATVAQANRATLPNGSLPQAPSTHPRQRAKHHAPVLSEDVSSTKAGTLQGREFGTQTDTPQLRESRQSLEAKREESPCSCSARHTPTPSPSGGVGGYDNQQRIPKATQTEQLSNFLVSKLNQLNAMGNGQRDDWTDELEQRTALLELIDSALEETIDKPSRQRTNQLIASTARKQAQVWRDVKEFMSVILLPCSVDLANRARSAEINYEQLASIQLP